MKDVKDENKVLKLVYTFFLGLMLALFVGLGVSTFYTAPVAPEYPMELSSYNGKELTSELKALEKEQNTKQIQWENDMKPYNRNVSIITMGAAVVFLALSLLFEEKINVLADGTMTGGLFMLIYSIGRGFASNNTKYSFVAVSFSLLVVLFLGYHRYVKVRVARTE